MKGRFLFCLLHFPNPLRPLCPLRSPTPHTPHPTPHTPSMHLDLYKNLPIYARLADGEDGLLRHVCNALQPHLNEIYRRIQDFGDYTLNPDTAPEEWLDWLGQFVGLAPVGERWLGLGLNPDWPAADKRRLLRGAWLYWQMKGTQWGIREAIALWLRWDGAHDRSRLQFRLPLGKVPSAQPPNIWSYATPYNAQLLQTYPERKHLGIGDELRRHQPDGFALRSQCWGWHYGRRWSDGRLVKHKPDQVLGRSHLGLYNPWMHFFLHEEEEWQRLFPDLFELNPEIWSLKATPTVFGWWVKEDVPLPLEENPAVARPTTQRLLAIDGFQYTHRFPWRPRPAAPRSPLPVPRSPSPWFGIWSGCRYTSLWGSAAELASAAVKKVTRTVWKRGHYPGTGYRDRINTRITQNEIEIAHHPGNHARAFSSSTRFGSGRSWYSPPRETRIETPALPVWVGSGKFWYAPPFALQIEVEAEPEPSAAKRAIPATQWYVPARRIAVEPTAVESEPPGAACLPGLESEIVVAREQRWVGGAAAERPKQLLERVEPTHTTVFHPARAGNYPGFGYSNVLPSLRTMRLAALAPLPAIDLSGLSAIASPATPIALPPPRHQVRNPLSRQPPKSWTFPAQASRSNLTQTPGRWQLAAPLRIFTHFSRVGCGRWWYFAGKPAVPPRLQSVPVTQRVRLCNVAAAWTRFRITRWDEVEVALPERQRPLGEVYPLLPVLAKARHWQLQLEVREELIVLQPVTIFWVDAAGKRALSFSPERFNRLLLEFVVKPVRSSGLRSAALVLERQRVVHYQQFQRSLSFDARGGFGFRFVVGVGA